MMMPFDPLLVAVLMIAVVISGMRVLYGAWPWEARKTWYRTRLAVDYVEAVRDANRESALRPLPLGEGSCSSDTLDGGLRALRQVTGDTSGDSFDRSLVVQENSPPEVVTLPAERAAERPAA